MIKNLFLASLVVISSFGVSAKTANLKPALCYTTANCVEQLGIQQESIVVTTCDGRRVGITLKITYECNYFNNKIYGVCVKEAPGYLRFPNNCVDENDLPNNI
jgi:hypothetical protein